MKTKPSSPHPILLALCLVWPWAATCPASAQGEPAWDGRCAVGALELTLRQATNGIALASLHDTQGPRELLAAQPAPLFEITLRHPATKKEARLVADQGWSTTEMVRTQDGLRITWRHPVDLALQDFSVTATAVGDPASSSLRWKLRVDNSRPEWGVWRVLFPQLTFADLGEQGAVFFPRGPGEVQKNVWGRPFQYRGNYADGWCSMQFLAVYREGGKPTGLYFAVHDPLGSTKNLVVESDPGKRSLRLAFDHPAPNMGTPGNDFDLAGEAVWQRLAGDWFDAATIYRDWARAQARWWPKLGREGREDTPPWMRDLGAWAMTGGAPADCVAKVQRFQQFLDIPVGFHWYNWHQIPFDNDYPHYFPTKPGVPQGVQDLQQSRVFVMPYINGRLWDLSDRGAEDFEFSRVARPAATKQQDGQPHAESYGSKETNGQPVRLAVMCPAAPLWQHTVSNIVLRLLTEVGTRAVYIDQVAAATPVLCMDPTHGHPLGGGHWWNEGYWKMLDDIRRAMPPGSMLTTECNGEPFVRWFDGYLTWHWQHDGQVPAFPAVYGGAIQLFGRAYRGGASKDLALRMKAAQQLCFGEQLGWIDPGVADEPENGRFFRQLAQLRARFSRYFNAGLMARPPQLRGEMPKLKADWQWSGEWWVNTDAVLTGAWQSTAENRLMLLFVNAGDAPVSLTLFFDGAERGIAAEQLRLTRLHSESDTSEASNVPRRFERPLSFPAREAQVWELSWPR